MAAPQPPPALTPFAGRPAPDGVYDELRFTGADLHQADAGGARFLDCEVVDADLTEAALPGSRWTDCRLSRVRGAGTDLSEATLQDVTLDEPRLGAPAGYGGSWRRVVVRGGKVEFLNLRGATLTEVTFEDCVLLEPDFSEATLTDVTFSGCILEGAHFDKARLSKVDLSEARLAGPTGLTSLRGATISRLQLLDLADAFAAQLGITVRDPGPAGRA